MNLHSYKEILSTTKQIRVNQIMLKLELKLMRPNGISDDHKKAIEETERELLELIKMTE